MATTHQKKPYVDRYKTQEMLKYHEVSLRGAHRSWEKPKESFLRSPKTLVELAAEIVDNMPLPECMDWKTPRVLEWLEDTVKLTQYKGCFEKNFVTGRRLILIEARNLVLMNICNFEHILKITSEIRQLLGSRRSTFCRDLTSPSVCRVEDEWRTFYLKYITRQAPQSADRFSDYLVKAKKLKGRLEDVCHWYNMRNYLMDIDQESIREKKLLARTRVRPGRLRYFCHMFREGHYLPTTVKVDYLEGEQLTW